MKNSIQIQCLSETPASLQDVMWKELQCLFFPTALIYTMIKLFFFALSNACSEYRFEVTPELEWLFLMLNLPITQTQHAKSANTCPHLTYLHLPLFDARKIV